MSEVPRIIVIVSGGVVQEIMSDRPVHVITVDHDNAEDAEFDQDSVEDMLSPELVDGSQEAFESALDTARDELEEAAAKNSGPSFP